MIVDEGLRENLQKLNIGFNFAANFEMPADSLLEPPLCLKWMVVHGGLKMGAFSYAVSGYYQFANIGRYVSIGEDVQIGRSDHPMDWASMSPVFYEDARSVLNTNVEHAARVSSQDFVPKNAFPGDRYVNIGNDVWIGHGAMVMPGVTIGSGAVVAAGSIVTRDVPPYAVVAGVPAKVKKMRFPEKVVERLLSVNWWDYAFWDLAGSPLTDVSAFLDEVERRVDAGLKPYQPDWVDLGKLAKIRAEV
jgi:acetyltransferase-like isoleucine patch superfamily enzyme